MGLPVRKRKEWGMAAAAAQLREVIEGLDLP